MQTSKNQVYDILQSRTDVNEVMSKQAAEQVAQQATTMSTNCGPTVTGPLAQSSSTIFNPSSAPRRQHTPVM